MTMKNRPSSTKRPTTKKSRIKGGDPNNDYDYNDDDDDDDDAVPSNQNRAAALGLESSGQGRSERETFDFLLDHPHTMTYGRRIALYLMASPWYYPKPKHDHYDDDDEDDDDDNDNGSKLTQLQESNTHGSEISNSARMSRGPHGSDVKPASLEKAWAYFDHVTLPRCVNAKDMQKVRKKSRFVRMYRKFMKWDQTLDRADPGESHKPTTLYSPIFTPISQMGDFGLGTGLYFTTLRAMTILTFVLGVINIPNMMYFAGPEYSDSQVNSDSQVAFPFFAKGSAMCTRTKWVPCPECVASNGFRSNLKRLAQYTNHENGQNVTLTFALQNNCNGSTFRTARISFVTLVFLVIGIVALKFYQKQWEIKFDEDEITARDYSIVIKNPPANAREPDQWRRYFERNFRAKVASVTVGIDNDLLVKTLVERRQSLRLLELELEPGTPLDVLSLARISSKIENHRNCIQKVLAWIFPGIPEHFGRLVVLTARVQGLAQQSYGVKNVFVTFAKETTKNRILEHFALGDWTIRRNNTDHMTNTNRGRLCFDGTQILKCREPDEPATIRWKDLNSHFSVRFVQMIATNVIASVGMFVTALLIQQAYTVSLALGSITISISNLVFPEFAKWLTDFESHFSEGDKQTSLYFKIALFRWINTAILITIITPFTTTISNEDGLIRAIYAIFSSELIATNVLRLADPYGHFQRHVLAPRSRTQDGMNLQMHGSEVELAERYTDMTKIIFLAFWYCAIFPLALFLCSFVLLVKFFVDRFGLMRTWKRVPPLGNRISGFSRKYFFSSAVVGLAVISSYYWAGFPYDNLCKNNNSNLDKQYMGNWTAKTLNTKDAIPVSITVETGAKEYRYCSQDMLGPQGSRAFPFIPNNQPIGQEWMTQEQEDVTTVYGWAAVVIIGLVGLSFLGVGYDGIIECFQHKHDVHKTETDVTFYDKQLDGSISSYVPMVESHLFPYPLLACKTEGIDSEMFGWTDPDRPHAYYDLTQDAEFLLQGIGISLKYHFSRIVYYPKQPIQTSGREPKEQSSNAYDDE